MVGFWLTNGYTLVPTQSYIRNNALFGEQKLTRTTQSVYYENSGKYKLWRTIVTWIPYLTQIMMNNSHLDTVLNTSYDEQ